MIPKPNEPRLHAIDELPPYPEGWYFVVHRKTLSTSG